ncbi:hypothetical protein VU06_00665 [Desulfobulbus sp. F3]|nr:hypothetical protein [Desulfobulbus sp. F3]
MGGQRAHRVKHSGLRILMLLVAATGKDDVHAGNDRSAYSFLLFLLFFA